jgi:hypothetical protein
MPLSDRFQLIEAIIDMDMETRWPGRKVYLYIVLAIFPSRLREAGITAQKMNSYFQAASIEGLILRLWEYQREAYFKVAISVSSRYEQQASDHRDLALGLDNPNFIPAQLGVSDGIRGPRIKCDEPLSRDEVRKVISELSEDQLREHLRFRLAGIKREKANRELEAYARQYQQGLPKEVRTAQYKGLRQAMMKKYPLQGYRPTINLADILAEKAESGSSFWAPVLNLHFDKRIEIEDVGYAGQPTMGGASIAQPYVQLKIIDPKLRKEVKAGKGVVHRTRSAPGRPLHYKGLVIDGGGITYHGTPFMLPYQQREVLRAFLSTPEITVAPDTLTNNSDIFARGPYPDKNTTLSKLISALRKNLEPVIGQRCIFNTNREGWYLRIE